MELYAYHLMLRLGSSDHLFRERDLFHQFLVDMYAKIESERLAYIVSHQKELRVDDYAHIALTGDEVYMQSDCPLLADWCARCELHAPRCLGKRTLYYDFVVTSQGDFSVSWTMTFLGSFLR